MGLEITKLRHVSVGYYLTDRASELESIRRLGRSNELEQDSIGQWIGAGAEQLGLSGAVKDSDFRILVAGKNPATGQKVASSRRVFEAFDVTINVPKGASIALAVGGDKVAQEVLRAHEKAVEAAFKYLERHVSYVALWIPEEHRLVSTRSQGLVAASFTHGVSRALDPHLHTHIVLVNMSQGPDDRWRALDTRALWENARAAGSLHEAELRWELSERLGVEWTPYGKGSHRMAGIDERVLRAFSTRHTRALDHIATEMPAEAQKYGPKKLMEIALLRTREPKSADRFRGDLRQVWKDRAMDFGFGEEDLAKAFDRSVTRDLVIDENDFAKRLSEVSRKTLNRGTIVYAWESALPQGVPADAVERCVDLLAPWPEATGAVQRRLPAEGFIPSKYQLLALGNRPASPDQLAVWLDTAKAIEKYRDTWGIKDPDRALGSEEWRRESTSTRESSREFILQLAGHHEASREIENARRQLGREREGPELGLSR
jgi:conjugative relaxase-like TrwC/TraI family protein